MEKSHSGMYFFDGGSGMYHVLSVKRLTHPLQRRMIA